MAIYNDIMVKGEIDINNLQSDLLRLIKKSGELARGYFEKKDVRRYSKKELDFVTDADLAVEKYLKSELSGKYPGVPVMAEESAHKNYNLYCREKSLFVIDPIDGTLNFGYGIDHYAISIALVSYGKPLLGICLASDTNKVYTARRDRKGAYCDNRKISVKNINRLAESFILTDWPHDLELRKKTAAFIGNLYSRVRFIGIYGSAVYDLLMISQGEIQGVYLTGCNPWDVAAASLIARKSGALLTDGRGADFDIFNKTLVAGVEGIHGELVRASGG